MITGRSPERADTAERAAPIHRLVQVLTATSLVAVCPVVLVWWLRSSGVLTSYLPGLALGMALSFGAAHAGRLFWQTRPGSEHLLFSELMIWGYIHRCYRNRRLASARALLGTMSQAQRRVEGGLTPERQTKLLEQLARAMDARDPKTHGHSRRVARYAWMIAMRMGLPREQVARIRTAAAVHDVGKFGTPLSILRKDGSLDDEQFEVMKRHPVDGAQLVSLLNDDELTAMVRHHHERLDGTGYPDRLAGDEIPLGARIISVADTFDAITAHRPYRAARPHKDGLEVLAKEAGRQLDPDVVRAFCGHYSGRRPLTFWASLTTLPERALAQVGSGVGTAAGTAKVATLAALIGALAAGTARLARPDHASSGHAPGLGSALARSSGSAAPARSAGPLPYLGLRRPAGAHKVRRAAGLSEPAGPAGSDPTGSTLAGRSEIATTASESPTVADPPGSGEKTRTGAGQPGAGQSGAGTGSGAAGGSGAGGGEGGEGTAESPALEESAGGVLRTVGGAVEQSGTTVGATVKQVTGTAGSAVTGAGGIVGGRAGATVEAIGGTVDDAGEGAGEIPARVTGGVRTVEELASKVTEAKGGLGGALGKL
jgi:hypothetical protein